LVCRVSETLVIASTRDGSIVLNPSLMTMCPKHFNFGALIMVFLQVTTRLYRRRESKIVGGPVVIQGYSCDGGIHRLDISE
jgi:hypothetical protein